jgi:hypothetical protein
MPQLNNVQDMIRWAEEAVSKTRQLLPNGNANSYSRIPGTWFRSKNLNQQVLITEAVSAAYNKPNVATTGRPLQFTLCDAKIAIGEKAGNCDHHASVAFAYLYANDCWPIHKVILPGHTFVILGDTNKNFNDPKANFVICDPWANLYGSNRYLEDWLALIWSESRPLWESFKIIATSDKAGGSEDEFKKLTAKQHANDRMDFSD